MKFRKTVIIEAVQLRWDNWEEMCTHANVGKLQDGKPEGCFIDKQGQPTKDYTDNIIGLLIPTLEGLMIGIQNDWIIKDIKGEIYPCKPDIFELTYEKFEG